MKRSPSNYRYYDYSMVERIFWIEKQKSKGRSLNDIKLVLNTIQPIVEEIDIQEIRMKMKQLEQDVAKLIGKMNEEEKNEMKKKVSTESLALMHSLLLLIQ